MLGLAVSDIARGRGIETLGEIRTGAERLAFGRKYDSPALRIGVERIECLGNGADERIVEIIVRRAPDLDGSHVAGEAHADVSVLSSNVHGNLPVWATASIVWLPLEIKRPLAGRKADRCWPSPKRGGCHERCCS